MIDLSSNFDFTICAELEVLSFGAISEQPSASHSNVLSQVIVGQMLMAGQTTLSHHQTCPTGH